MSHGVVSLGQLLERRVAGVWHADGRVLHLGCGKDYRPSVNGTTWVNADRYAAKVDERVDLFAVPWPWPDGHFDAVLSHQFLEHVPQRIGDEDGLIVVLQEVARVLRPGGRFLATVPYANSKSDLNSITHYRRFVEGAFDFLSPASASTLKEWARLPLTLLRIKVIRSVRLTKWFDSTYHIPRYFGRFWNLGWKEGLAFVFERAPLPQPAVEVR